MANSGMACVKCLLFLFNFFFFVTGVVILSVGCVTYFTYADYQNFVYDSFESVPILLIAIGIIIFVVALFGCCGACLESNCMVLTFSLSLLVILMLEVVAGVAGYMLRNEVGQMLESKLNATMYMYYDNDKIKDTWDIAQHEAECCGMNGFNDWHKVNNNTSLPHTCCPDAPDDGSCTIKSPDVYQAACFLKLKEAFTKYDSIVGGVAIGVAVVQMLAILYACCLVRTL